MGQTINLEDGGVLEFVGDPQKSFKIGGALLGKGGQGEVYKVKNKQTGQLLALKTYFEPKTAAFLNNLRQNIGMGAPNTSFLWPLGLIEPLGKNQNRYGYVMDLYGKEYSSFAKLIKGNVNFASKETQIAALINLVEAFEVLHSKGFSYQDLNDGGVQFDCNTGKILIADNDNVAPYGKNLGIKGKFKWMAPEVAINMFKPDKYSDRFSLAVFMFLLLTHAHPYDGIKRLSGPLTRELEEKVYGTEPIFIFHPTDKSNRPDPKEDHNAIDAWPMLPSFIQELFINTFTCGMPYIGKKRADLEQERQGRTTEMAWKKALYRWLDTMVSCPHCGKSLCVTVQNGTILEEKCPHCGKKTRVNPPVLVIKKNGEVERTIVLEEGKRIAKSSVTNELSNEPAFIVRRSKKVAGVYGIENLLSYQWKCSQQGAKDKLVNTHEIVPALNGVNIEFDYVFSAEVVVK